MRSDMRSGVKSLLVLILLGALSACQSDIPENDYFPLHKGVVWHYEVTNQWADQVDIEQFSITNLGPVQMSGDYADQPVSVRRSSDGTDYYILQDDTGSHRIGKRTVVELKPVIDKAERKILPGYADLEEGRFWTLESQPFILRGTGFHSLPDPSLKKFTMTNEITEVDATVTVPAGTFSGCVVITGVGIISIYADPRLGYQDIEIVQTEWYAPGVGLVKLLREEPMDLPMFKGGTVSFELERFEP
ncbi:hypothetical protein [Neptuniibacter sp.]|uniref:hypothetical protein n=1 Tax=Neptuniibacter sp. TaxID=1962643 RepID=UPI00262D71F9|nr:hypothetical protein [Neptuniibacter sp.]MCP4595449.1 hypothetical protein [Neptuniibacter sp.]